MIKIIITELKKVLEKMIILSSSCNDCKDKDADEVWYIANNLDEPTAIREYKKRFDIDEMLKGFKGGRINIEKTWCEDIHYIRILYLCVSIAYC
jgi:hypothetical protein